MTTRTEAAAATWHYWVAFWTPIGPAGGYVVSERPIASEEAVNDVRQALAARQGVPEHLIAVLTWTLLRVDGATDESGARS